ncbi:intercellular adhesion molecule 5-like [Chiloscyllium plagiosum]|uniref:intercellular adhesion molecule 5-like n=1 Tax=Chiloscyllium plagiosum TaxID=36176 RepID=UPI001CB88880|nr:intercellular adhesion molecule 5-like [Chiloscyllium plagiosum]
MDSRLTSLAECIWHFKLLFIVTATVTGFEVSIDVNPPAVEFGGSIAMNCSTTCPKPTINVEYKSGVNFHRKKGITWYNDYFPIVQQWDLTPACSVMCISELKEKTANVPVYNREISITLLPEVLEINRTYSLECIGPRVYPNNKLILTWLRGSEIVQRDSTGEPGLPDEDKRLRNVFNFVASRSDDGQEYTCLAEVDLGSNTTKSITNSSVTLQTYAFMDQPIILDKRPKEVKQEVTLTCEVSNVYPAEKMRVRWFQDGVELNSDTTRPNSNTVRITAAWTPQESGLMEVVCMADFEKYPSIPPKNNSAFIEVYAFSSPEIQVPTSQEGNLVNITCLVLNVSGDLELRLKKGNDTLVNGSSSTGLTISHTVEAQAKLDGQQYICEAELKLQDQSMTSPVIKQQIETLHVLYAPAKAEIFKAQENWIEGVSQNLTCHGQGNPDPQRVWIKDGRMESREILYIPSVQMQHGGLYVCTVKNEHGSKTSSLNATILYKPRDTIMTISVNNKTISGNNTTMSSIPVEVTKGDEITISCKSNGRPSPTLEWVNPCNGSNIEIGPSGFLHIPYVTSEHQGIYKCRATNQHGVDEKEVDLRVKGLRWIIPVVVVIAAVLLIIALMALYWKCSAHKRGHYNVQNAKPNKNLQIPNGHEHQQNVPLKNLDPYHGETLTNGLNQ